jgi:16S rRNA (guanine966-N2)-methyltransferase
VTRIISGFAGSRTLATPGAGTRPTSDRIREAIFSALDSRDIIEGARVLDLYAGSGALGLEAASRGASTVTLVDRLAAAVKVCRSNAAIVQKGAPAGLAIQISAQAVLPFLLSSREEWDLVFIDPPYDLPEDDLAATLSALVDRLAPDAVICLERSSRSPEPSIPAGLHLDRSKQYGDTTLWWLARA